jgi:hypothetical protein
MMRRPMARRRGIGLLGATAVAGTAYVAGSAGAKRSAQDQEQEARLADLEQQQAQANQPTPAQPAASQPAPEAPATSQDEKIRQLKELGELKQAGILTTQEFDVQKQKILNA